MTASTSAPLKQAIVTVAISALVVMLELAGLVQGSWACWSFPTLLLRTIPKDRGELEHVKESGGIHPQSSLFRLLIGLEGARFHLGLVFTDGARSIRQLTAEIMLLPFLLDGGRIAVCQRLVERMP